MISSNKLSSRFHCLPVNFLLFYWMVILVVSKVQAFPSEVFDDKYQFTKEGDINLGAILSIHGKYRMNDGKISRSRFKTNATPAPETGTNVATSGKESERSRFVKESQNDDKNIGDLEARDGYGAREETQYKSNSKIKEIPPEMPLIVDDSESKIISTESSNPMASVQDGFSQNVRNDVISNINCSTVLDIREYRKHCSQPKSSKVKQFDLRGKMATPTHLKLENNPNINHESHSNKRSVSGTTQSEKTTPSSPTTTPSTTFFTRSEKSQMYDSPSERICSPEIANFQSLENMVAILFALDEINARKDLLPDIEIGITILDDCFTPSLARSRALQFMPGASQLQASGGIYPRKIKRRRRRRHQQHQSLLDVYRKQQKQKSQESQLSHPHYHHQDPQQKRIPRSQSQQHLKEQYHKDDQYRQEQQRQQKQQRQLSLEKQHHHLQHQQSQHLQHQHEQQQQHQLRNSSADNFPETHFLSDRNNKYVFQSQIHLRAQHSQIHHHQRQRQGHRKINQNKTEEPQHTHKSQSGRSIRKSITLHYPHQITLNQTYNSNSHIIANTRDRQSLNFPTSHTIKTTPQITTPVRQVNNKIEKEIFFQEALLSFPSFPIDNRVRSNNNDNTKSTDTERRKNNSLLGQAINLHHFGKQRMAMFPFLNIDPGSTSKKNTATKLAYKLNNNNNTLNLHQINLGKKPGSNFKLRKHARSRKWQKNQEINTTEKQREKEKGNMDLFLMNRENNDHAENGRQTLDSKTSISPKARPFFSSTSRSKIETSKEIDHGRSLQREYEYRRHRGNDNKIMQHYSPKQVLLAKPIRLNGLHRSNNPTKSLALNNITQSLTSPQLSPSQLPLSLSLSSPLFSNLTTIRSISLPPSSLTVPSMISTFKPSMQNTLHEVHDQPRLTVRKTRDTFQYSKKNQSWPPAHNLPKFYDVVGILGAYTSSLSVEVADVMTIFNLPQISHAATTDILGDTTKYPVFFRTVPADHYQIQTMADLLQYFGWKYVSIVFSADAYGTRAEKSLRALLHDLDICVAQSVELNDSMAVTDYDNVIFTLRSHRNARVVVLYADLKHISPLMAAVRTQNAYHEFIWAGSDTTSLVSDMEVENCKHIIGSLSITMNASAPPKFKDYLYHFLMKHEDILKQFAWKDPEKLYSLFREFLDVVRLKPYIDKEFFDRLYYDKYIPTFTVSYAIDAVYAFAHAIQGFIRDNCPGASKEEAKRCIQGRSIIPYLRSVDFQGTSGKVSFNEYGDVVSRIAISQCQMHSGVAKQVPIAIWDAKSKRPLRFHSPRQWPNKSTSVPTSLCAEACTGNEIYVFPKQTCCWHCVKCKVNEITILNKTRCSQCPDLYWPDETTFLACHKIKPSYIRIRDLLPLALAVITTLGLMISFVTGFTFYTYRTDRIIRSSSKELSSIMLVGIFCAFLLVLSLLSEPTNLKCYINHVGFGMTFTLVYGPLLVKTNRIYRIFTTSRKSAALPKRTSSAWQLLFTSGFILVQVTIVTISIIFAPPQVTHSMPEKTDKYVIGYCDLRLAGFLPSIAYNFALVLICTWYAFKTRRFPDNYNESRYIAFCVDTTVLVWISFIPTYFAMKRPYYKVVILALALLINSIVCLLLLFVPKLYTLYVSKQRPSSQNEGRENGRDFHMQLMSNFSMSGLIRSTPSFYNGDSNDVEEKTDSVLVQSPPPHPPLQHPPLLSSNKRQPIPASNLCSINEQGVRFVTSTSVLITANSQTDS